MSLLDYSWPGHCPVQRRAGLTLLAVAIVMLPTDARAQELQAETRARVAVEIDGVTLAQFQEVSGINAARGTKWANITLKRGTTDSRALMQWHEAGRARGADAARKNGSIVMYDASGKPVSRWNFTNAWPSKIEIGALKAGASEVLVESLTISCETIERGR